MNCTDFEIAVEAAVESRTSLPPNAFAHASGCSTCNESLARYHRLETSISAWRATAVPLRLADRVLNELKVPDWSDDPNDLCSISSELEIVRPQSRPVEIPTHRERRPQSSRSRHLALVLVVACLFMAIFGTAFISSTQQSAELISKRSQKPQRRHRPMAYTSRVVSNTLSRVMSDLRSEYDEMANETNSAIHEVVNVIPQRVAASVMPEAEEFEVLIPDSSEVNRVWKPIEARVETALGFLLRAVPSDAPSG